MVCYKHSRFYGADGTLLARGGVTYAYIMDDKNIVYSYATANCGPRDNYNKQYGRMKAKGRLSSSRYALYLAEPIEEKYFLVSMSLL